MTTIYHPNHPHYAIHKAFVEGSFANPDEPPVVQVKFNDGWDDEPSQGWFLNAQYRIKPRTITRTVTYPEPLRVAPAHGTEIWLVYPHLHKPRRSIWDERNYGRFQMFENGMVFSNEAAAQQCYDALFKGDK